ncbi:MAG: hypothetical protein V3W34_00905 [Phycisphaerae bacterium]
MAEQPTYPNEAYPADTTVLALDGTVDVETGLPYIAKGVGPNSTPTYEIQYNRRLLRQNQILVAVRQGMVVDEGSLKIGVYPISYRLGGSAKWFPGATSQAVPDDSVRSVYIDSSNALQIQSVSPQDETIFLPLATVTTSAGSMTIVDDRPGVLVEVAPVGPSAKTLPFAPSVFLSGTLSVKVWEIEWVAPVGFTLKDVTGRVNTAPVGADLVVDIRVNGTSIFSLQSDMVVIADGTQQDKSTTVDHAVTAGDVITFEIEQVGSTTAGADLTLVVNGLAAVGSA